MRRLVEIVILALGLTACGNDDYEKARALYAGSRTNVPSEQQGYSEPLGQATALLENFLSHNHEDPRAMLLLWRCYLRTGNPRVLAMHESMIRNAEHMRRIMLEEIEDESDSYMRVRMVNLFGEIATTTEVEDLLEILEEDAHPSVQEAAAQVLSGLRDTRALAPLLDKLQASDENIRAFACRALAAFPQPDINNTLFGVLVNDQETNDVRANAGFALAELALAQTDLKSAIIAKLQLPISNTVAPLTTQILAAMVLAKLGINSGKQLAEAHAFSTNAFVRGIAIIILGEVGTEEAVPLIAPAMASENAKLRLQAAEALGKLGDAKGLPSLYQAVNDPVESVRQAAQASIEKIRHKTTPR